MKKPDTVEDATAALIRIREIDGLEADVDIILGVLKRLARGLEHATQYEHERKAMLAIAKTVLKDE